MNTVIVTIPEMRPLADKYFATGDSSIPELIALQNSYVQDRFWLHYYRLQAQSRIQVSA